MGLVLRRIQVRGWAVLATLIAVAAIVLPRVAEAGTPVPSGDVAVVAGTAISKTLRATPAAARARR